MGQDSCGDCSLNMVLNIVAGRAGQRQGNGKVKAMQGQGKVKGKAIARAGARVRARARAGASPKQCFVTATMRAVVTSRIEARPPLQCHSPRRTTMRGNHPARECRRGKAAGRDPKK